MGVGGTHTVKEEEEELVLFLGTAANFLLQSHPLDPPPSLFRGRRFVVACMQQSLSGAAGLLGGKGGGSAAKKEGSKICRYCSLSWLWIHRLESKKLANLAGLFSSCPKQ